MRLLRGLGGSLLWVVASVVCLLGVVLCITIVLLPLGIVLLRLGRRLYSASFALFLPRAARHPVDTATDKIHDVAQGAASGLSDLGPSKRRVRKKARKAKKKLTAAAGR